MTDQPSLLDWKPPKPRLGSDFDGITYHAPRDHDRLNAQLRRVYDALADGEWHTPEELERRTGDRWASISARCRDLRKPKIFGAVIERRYVSQGLWEYRMVRP